MDEEKYSKRERKYELMFEFLLFGIVVGVVEDLIAIVWIGGGEFTFKTLVLVVMLAVPFAIVGELVADRVDFVRIYRRLKRVYRKYIQKDENTLPQSDQ